MTDDNNYYDEKKRELGRASAIDSIILRDGDNGKEILLIERLWNPYEGCWALPGGKIEFDETIEETCIREVEEETGLIVKVIKALKVRSNPRRDSRQFISHPFICNIISGELKAGDDAKNAQWWNINSLPKIAFDHAEIIEEARGYLER